MAQPIWNYDDVSVQQNKFFFGNTHSRPAHNPAVISLLIICMDGKKHQDKPIDIIINQFYANSNSVRISISLPSHHFWITKTKGPPPAPSEARVGGRSIRLLLQLSGCRLRIRAFTPETVSCLSKRTCFSAEHLREKQKRGEILVDFGHLRYYHRVCNRIL